MGEDDKSYISKVKGKGAWAGRPRKIFLVLIGIILTTSVSGPVCVADGTVSHKKSSKHQNTSEPQPLVIRCGNLQFWISMSVTGTIVGNRLIRKQQNTFRRLQIFFKGVGLTRRSDQLFVSGLTSMKLGRLASSAGISQFIEISVSAMLNCMKTLKPCKLINTAVWFCRFANRPDQWRSMQASKQSFYVEFYAAFGSNETKPSRSVSFIAEASKNTSQPKDIKKMRKEIDHAVSGTVGKTKKAVESTHQKPFLSVDTNGKKLPRSQQKFQKRIQKDDAVHCIIFTVSFVIPSLSFVEYAFWEWQFGCTHSQLA
ncbi:hypothetical protein GH714_036595 [Hevea brasiliensis]|uniref:Uncharacterized protein n=1 Tax=Hevea brasiliensis TaxID=3981 RepID=A0A6A6NEW8_HEVBR|nr:hypothetical protein GH714_036595 [Hevea brasiliensis]